MPETEPPVSDSGDGAAGAIKIGRFLVLQQLGRGSMGVVYAAYDEMLDRRVALKVIRRDISWQTSVQQRTRREAQALAKLSHRNVVQVYEVGEVDGKIFIAMEYLHGRTLTAWLKESERSWRELLDMFVEAGRGLAAAHAAKLIHRDFKPDNVIVGEDGRVCVVDFGLVSGDRRADDVDSSSAPVPANSLTNLRLTQAGAVLGTPAYMSPEQHSRMPVDARSDQFSFCVALWEALYGARPFTGSSREQLAASILLSTPKPPPRSPVPARVQAALLRGLAATTDRRHASMEELLAQLTREPPPVRAAPWLVLGALVVGGLGLGYWTAGPAPCGPGGLSREWTANREPLAAVLRRSNQPYARETSERAVEALDRYVDAWSAQSLDVCEAHRDGRQPQRLVDLRTLCLERRRQELTALLVTLGPGDVEQALQAISSLRAPVECNAVATLVAEQERTLRPPDPETEHAVAAASLDLERARQAERLRREDELARLLAVLQDSPAVRHPPFAASVHLLRSRLEDMRGHYTNAERQARLAWLAGLRGGSLEVAAQAAVLRASVQSLRLARFEAAEESLAEAEAVFETLGDDPAREASLTAARGLLAATRGDPAAAEIWYRKTLAAVERLHGSDEPRTGAAANDLAGALRRQNRLDEALPLYLRALAIAEASYGPHHPAIATPLNNLGNVYYDLQRHADAQRYYERTLALSEGLGSDHPEVANALNNLANNLLALDRSVEAVDLHTRALQIRERALGPSHPEVAVSLANRAMADAALGRHAEATASLERALQIQRATLGATHPDLASTYNVLGNLRFAVGDFVGAVREYNSAVQLCEQAASHDPSELAAWLFNLGNTQLALGQHRNARATLLRSLTLAERSQVSLRQLQQPLMALARLDLEAGQPLDALAMSRRALALDDATFSTLERAELRFVAARAAWASGADERAKAEALAREALTLLREASLTPPLTAEIEAWLRQPALRRP